MQKRYFRAASSKSEPENIHWIEMSGREFYRFINSPEGQGHYFIDMGDVVLETSKEEAHKYKAEQNHRYYIQSQSEDWRTISIYAISDESGYSGEEAVADETQDVENEVIMRMSAEAVRKALSQLDAMSYQLIHALYLSPQRKTERELAQDLGISQNAVNKQKKKILKTLKFLVVKIQKSQQ